MQFDQFETRKVDGVDKGSLWRFLVQECWSFYSVLAFNRLDKAYLHYEEYYAYLEFTNLTVNLIQQCPPS